MSKQHSVCALSDLRKSNSIGFSIDEVDGFVLIVENEARAFVNSCPHMGTNLDFVPHRFLDSAQAFIQCAMHGALFEKLTGKCVHGPCVGQSLISLEASIVGDEVLVTIE